MANHPNNVLLNNDVEDPRVFMHVTHAESTSRHNLNIHNVIQPFVDTARSVNALSITNLLQNTTRTSSQPQQEVAPSQGFVINVEEPTVQNETTNNNQNNNNVTEHNINVQEYLRGVLKYFPFVMILLAKATYDYHDSIFILTILFITFMHTNAAVKREITKKHRRSFRTLGMELVYLALSMVFIHQAFYHELETLNLIPNLVLFREFVQHLTVGNLLWIVTVTDLTLKLFTVTVKILFTMLPETLVPFQRRGKYYLFIEATSQMYRSVAAIQPWLNYLLESYQGREKIVAVFLSAFYMISKSVDLMARLTLFKASFAKLAQNLAVGSSPTSEEIKRAGDCCPICHDDYASPVLLQCKHIFCESCVTTWLDQEQTCPLCRAKVASDPAWRDGSTSYFLQLY